MSRHTSQSRRTSVLIVGFGQMGHAMQALLGRRTHLSFWRVTPERQQPSPAVLKAARQADFIILCVPTIAISTLLTELQAYLDKRTAVLSVAKGLDETGRTATDILQMQFGIRARWGMLGGPMIANELRAGRSGFAEFGSRSAVTQRLVGNLFRGTQLHLISSSKPRAVSWCGVLKNVYVPLFGLADGLGWGDNLRGQLASAALAEINRLVQHFSGARHAADGAAGLADLITTATSRSSHHRALGWRVAHGDRHNLQGEGPHTVRVLQHTGALPGARGFPLLHVAATLVHRPAAARAKLSTWIETTA
ncbi:MAG: hypothetical protein ACYDCJ_11895 [Gammaproteobacteria bacterium]